MTTLASLISDTLSLTDNARIIIYDCDTVIIQATGATTLSVNDTLLNHIYHNDSKHKGHIFDIQHKPHPATLYTQCPSAECRLCWVSRFIYCSCECLYYECLYAKCHWTECRYGHNQRLQICHKKLAKGTNTLAYYANTVSDKVRKFYNIDTQI
jgi:hypothetical protein